VKIGVQFPNEAIVRDVGAIRDFAQTAEGLGYSHLLVYEHVIGVDHADRTPPLGVPYNEKTEFHESLVLLGFLSAVTTTIGLATGIVVLPQRQTGLLAKQAAEVAVLSGDRLRLGVGVGWNYVEFEALNQDFASRGPRSSEQMELLRMFWSQSLVDFKGQWHTIDRAGIAPRPERPIPLWVGGFSEPAYRRAAQLGDGLIYSLMGTAGPDPDPKGTIEHVRTLVAEAGREAGSFGVELLAPLPMSPGDFAELADQWRDTGIDYLTLHLQHGEYHEPADYVGALEVYMKALG
jgi:probable F420-dependent oxidoreductase